MFQSDLFPAGEQLPSMPLAYAIGTRVAALLASGRHLARADISGLFAQETGVLDWGSAWTIDDYNNAVEIGALLWLREASRIDLATSVHEAEARFDWLEAALPPRHVRSEAQVELQQFSTPPMLAWLMAKAAAVSAHDTLLEPSAGNGALALWGCLQNASLLFNEIDPARRDGLAHIFPSATITAHDGELIDYLAKSFPVRLMQVFADDDGNLRSEAMSDEEGNPVFCPRAIAARDALIEQLCALPPIATALDAIIEHFGTEAVAEVTGRTRRLVSGRDGQQRLERRSPSANVAEAQSFMEGTKRILVFSDAGGTGRSYHADLGCRNQQRRVHFLLEPGWRADNAIQGLGRTNRTNQASAPLFRPVTTDVKGERRFISTIARRLDALGALTRGQRQTGGQNLFDPADNLESDYARDALSRWFQLLYDGKLEATTFGNFVERTGLRLESPDGGLTDNLPTIQRWLNRILALPIALQNAIFEEYLGLVEARIEAAREAGTLDQGLETVRVDRFTVLADELLRTDPVTGAETRLVSLEVTRHLRPLRLQRLVRMHEIGSPHAIPMRNARSGKVALSVPARRLIADDGAVIERRRLLRPLNSANWTLEAIGESQWEEIGVTAFTSAWRAEEVEAAKSPVTELVHLATGLLLPVWKRLPGDHVRVTRLVAEDGQTIIGREVLDVDLAAVAETFGLSVVTGPSAERIGDLVIASGKPLGLASHDALTVKRSLVGGEQRLELTGFSPDRLDWYKNKGCFTEIIRYRTRLFVPVSVASSVLPALAA